MNVQTEWKLLHAFHKIFRRKKIKLLKKQFAVCGEKVTVPHSIILYGDKLEVGNNVLLGENGVFMCTRAPIKIGDNVMFGPGVTMISGDHRIDIKGKYMVDITDNDKLPENDQPIILKGDNWIGSNVTILKGVTIGEGAVVAAGSVVTKDLPDYSISAGVPARVLKYRFEGEELIEHKKMLEKNYSN